MNLLAFLHINTASNLSLLKIFSVRSYKDLLKSHKLVILVEGVIKFFHLKDIQKHNISYYCFFESYLLKLIRLFGLLKLMAGHFVMSPLVDFSSFLKKDIE